VDLQPDYVQLRNLFRQVQPSYLVAAGQNQFLEDLVQLLDLPEDTDINKFKVRQSKGGNAHSSNVSFYPYNRKQQQKEFRQKIYYDLELPGLPPESSRSDRQVFIASVFPMNQELAVIAMGNLLKYLDDNQLKWRHIFMNMSKQLIISSLSSFRMESQVQIDDTTFNSLNIFSSVYHPSSFKIQVRKDGLSLFNLLNECCSSIGVQELKNILKQPTRDMKELNLRYSTIEWCLKDENFDSVGKLRSHLKNLLKVGAVVQRIITNYGKTSDWKSLKKTVYHSFLICELCASYDAASIRHTFLHELAGFVKNELTIKGILFALDRIVDLDGVEKTKQFTVKAGLDALLDEKRANLKSMMEDQSEFGLDESLKKMNSTENAFRYTHFPEMGFVIGSDLPIERMDLDSIEENGIEIVLQTVDAVYFRTPNSRALNEDYDRRKMNIISHQTTIFNRLVKYISENMAELSEISKLCAKLDCIMSMASVSIKRKFVKPTLTTAKRLEIVNGRHPLVEKVRDYIPSSTIVDETNRSFINIINAPNASGKSVYMKQVALICYMAHIGCFVPADKCTISLMHSIFTRIYTPESVYQGESAFMADLQQMSKVIMNSNERSLILVDEFGKGTNFKDGIALLTASIEHFVGREALAPIAFITTHYYQIYDLLQSKQMINLKTILTRKNEAGVFESVYHIVDGKNKQNSFTEFPESKKIMMNLFEHKNK